MNKKLKVSTAKKRTRANGQMKKRKGVNCKILMDAFQKKYNGPLTQCQSKRSLKQCSTTLKTLMPLPFSPLRLIEFLTKEYSRQTMNGWQVAKMSTIQNLRTPASTRLPLTKQIITDSHNALLLITTNSLTLWIGNSESKCCLRITE